MFNIILCACTTAVYAARADEAAAAKLFRYMARAAAAAVGYSPVLEGTWKHVTCARDSHAVHYIHYSQHSVSQLVRAWFYIQSCRVVGGPGHNSKRERNCLLSCLPYVRYTIGRSSCSSYVRFKR